MILKEAILKSSSLDYVVHYQDFDGWTPLHAAAHWAQKEVIFFLTRPYVISCSGYCFDHGTGLISICLSGMRNVGERRSCGFGQGHTLGTRSLFLEAYFDLYSGRCLVS